MWHCQRMIRTLRNDLYFIAPACFGRKSMYNSLTVMNLSEEFMSNVLIFELYPTFPEDSSINHWQQRAEISETEIIKKKKGCSLEYIIPQVNRGKTNCTHSSILMREIWVSHSDREKKSKKKSLLLFLFFWAIMSVVINVTLSQTSITRRLVHQHPERCEAIRD